MASRKIGFAQAWTRKIDPENEAGGFRHIDDRQTRPTRGPILNESRISQRSPFLNPLFCFIIDLTASHPVDVPIGPQVTWTDTEINSFDTFDSEFALNRILLILS